MCTFFLVVAFRDARFLSGLYGRFSYIVMPMTNCMGETPLSSAKISELLFKETFCRRNTENDKSH